MSHIEKQLHMAEKPRTKFTALALGILIAVSLAGLATPSASAASGFNQYGYNYGARIFSGLADGVDKSLDGAVWGVPTYANDHLVMKWNAAWDACNTTGKYVNPIYCAGAWTTNEWNGMIPGGSQETEHYKMIWVGELGAHSTYFVAGGYLVWGNYEVIMDQGTSDHIHFWGALATPNGLGTSK